MMLKWNRPASPLIKGILTLENVKTRNSLNLRNQGAVIIQSYVTYPDSHFITLPTKLENQKKKISNVHPS